MSAIHQMVQFPYGAKRDNPLEIFKTAVTVDYVVPKKVNKLLINYLIGAGGWCVCT